MHLADEFPDWDVDCEYNRNGHEPKTLNLAVGQARTDDEDGRTVFPDTDAIQPTTLLLLRPKKPSSRGPDSTTGSDWPPMGNN